MDGGGDAVSGYEQAYASTAVHTKHIAAMTREERRKIIEDYQNSVNPADKAGLLSTSPTDNVNSGNATISGDPDWSTTNGNIIARSHKNIIKLGNMFKKKKSDKEDLEVEPTSGKPSEPMEASTSPKSHSGFQKLADE